MREVRDDVDRIGLPFIRIGPVDQAAVCTLIHQGAFYYALHPAWKYYIVDPRSVVAFGGRTVLRIGPLKSPSTLRHRQRHFGPILLARPLIFFHAIDVKLQIVETGLRRDLAIECDISPYAFKRYLQTGTFIVINRTGLGAIGPGMPLLLRSAPACIAVMHPRKFAEIVCLKALCRDIGHLSADSAGHTEKEHQRNQPILRAHISSS